MGKPTTAESTGSKSADVSNPQAQLEAAAAKRKEWFAKQKEKGEAILKKTYGKLPFMFFLLLCAFSLFSIKASAIMTAGLYIFSHDGRFSGREDGNVLMRNNRTRKWVFPAIVRNAYTMTARGILSVLSSGYRGLSASDIASWLATEYTNSNRFGLANVVKGKNAYVGLNTNLVNIGVAPNTTAPAFSSVPGITAIPVVTMVASTGVQTFAFSPSPTDATVTHELYATKPLSAGITKPSKSAFRLIDIVPPGSTTPYNFASTYVAKYGAITTLAGQKVFLQLYAVNIVTGQRVPSVGASGVIA